MKPERVYIDSYAWRTDYTKDFISDINRFTNRFTNKLQTGENKMNKQEILEEINKTEEHLTNLKKMLDECEYERWKPEPNEEYYYVSEDGKVIQTRNCGWEPATNKVKFYNCFKSEKQAEQEAEKVLTRRQLEDIARRLNKGKEIDWDDENQNKYFIRFNHWEDIIQLEICWKSKFQGVIYCLDENFLDVAKSEIGEERLKAYLGGE